MHKDSLKDPAYLKFVLSDPVGWICLKICEKYYPDEFPKEKDLT